MLFLKTNIYYVNWMKNNDFAQEKEMDIDPDEECTI